MLTLALLLLPLLASLGTFMLRREAVKVYALISSAIQFGLTAYVLCLFTGDAGEQFQFNFPWVEALGISLHMGLDGISILLVALTNVLVPLIILSSFRNNYSHPAAFYGLILFMQFALVGVFAALDGFLFYIFWELALIPIWFICLLWGGADRVRITLKFFIYTLTGSLLMLVGLILIYLQTPAPHSFSIEALYQASLTAEMQGWLFWCFFIAFAIKIPVFPLHTWQPDTYTDAPAQGSMLLSGIMLKMGIYGIIRWMLPVLPEGIAQWGEVAMMLCATGIVYASCLAIVQKDFKRLIAYSSIAHVGLITAGVFTLTISGLQGSMVQMLAHGVNVTGLFFIADIIQRRMKTREMSELGGLANNTPLFTILFMIVLLGSVALPLTNGFVGEFLLLNGVYQYSAWLAAVCGLTIILGAVYMFRAYQKVMLGEAHERSVEFTGLANSEKAVLIIIAFLILAGGIYPKPILTIAQPALEEVLLQIQDIY
ncbi:MAG: NADH-quinone oxidoreductase subunit M [Bacteroidia bacterium]|nr:NADH-quinone oxidoreductase subunit M [Bacteroidia bacterium]